MEQKNQKPMTIEEFDKLIEDNTYTYELIDGELVMQARPNVKHQNIMSNLHYLIKHYLKDKPCKVFTEVELEIIKDVIVPDISVICNIDSLDVQRFKQPPTLVIEILSPSNTTDEINTKLYKYKNHGIKECWIIEPKFRSIEVKNLENNIAITYIQSGIVKSNTFPDLEMDLYDIFE